MARMVEINAEMIAELRRLADAATGGEAGATDNPHMAFCQNREHAAFLAAVNPRTVLALLDRIGQLEKSLERADDSVRKLEREADWLAQALETFLEHDCHIDGGEYNWKLCPRNLLEMEKYAAIGCSWKWPQDKRGEYLPAREIKKRPCNGDSAICWRNAARQGFALK